MDPLDGFLDLCGVNDELDRLRAENERLHARVSDLTARLKKCADMHRRGGPDPPDRTAKATRVA